MYTSPHRRTFRIGFAHAGREIAMTQANLRLVEGTFMDKTKAHDAALSQSERDLGNGSIMRLGKKESRGLDMIKAIEPDAELFALAEQVDLAEKAFHDALARRNEAQIAYLREPSIMTCEAFEAAKTAEAVALEILDTEICWLANTRATTVIGLKLKASASSPTASSKTSCNFNNGMVESAGRRGCRRRTHAGDRSCAAIDSRVS
jgi:hypothetical protein